jgi:hypothetical protein
MKYTGLLFLACCFHAQAADREFTDVVRAISLEFRTQPMRIPLFGLVNAVTFFVRPAGTKHIDLAVFENLDSRGRDGVDMAASIRTAVGGSWKPFIQVRSSKGETVLVYLRPHGSDCKLLVATVERREATVVQLQLNPEGLKRWMESPAESSRSIFNRH